MKLTPNETNIVAELKANVESALTHLGENWGCVYLSNCKSSSTKGWNGTLASLAKKGLYKIYNDGENFGCFGLVKIDETKE